MAMMPKTPLHVRLGKCSLAPRRRFDLKEVPQDAYRRRLGQS
jgi:hypothetical protein